MEYIPSKDETKKLLPLEFVCSRLGINFNSSGRATCPFHNDTEPSLYMWEGNDGVKLWWCQPCGFGGDVFSLIQRSFSCTFPEAISRARAFLQDVPENYVPPVTVSGRSREISMDEWEQHVLDAQARAEQEDHSGYMAARIGLAPLADTGLCTAWDKWIRANWRWGVDERGNILMPHYTREGILAGCKVRSPAGDRWSLDGSVYSGQLYGAWKPKNAQNVLLTEGETDCIFAACQRVREKVSVDVMALPAGAGDAIDDRWLLHLKEYETVYLAFDPDKAGIAATWKWLNTLTNKCRVCFLPLGRDLRDASPSISNLLKNAGFPIDCPEGIATDRKRCGYFRPDKDANEIRITNWWLEPTSRLVGDDESSGYEVVIHDRGREIKSTVRLKDLASVREVVKWCGKHSLVYADNDVNLKKIVRNLEWRGSVVPDVYTTDQVGIQNSPTEYAFAGSSAVFPRGYVGKLPWRYVSSVKSADVSDRVLLPSQGVFHWNWLERFLELSEPAVTHPMLAWGVAAARRLEFPQFPLLFIGGSSGVGKSTLAHLLLRLLGSKIEVDLGAVTPFILMRTLASSTTVPVFVDEWTRMSRKDSRESFQGAIPILYTGGIGERGQADLTSMKYKLKSPVVVAGEDTFMLEREIERTVTVAPSRSTQNYTALTQIAEKPIERFGQLLYTWLTTNPKLPPIPNQTQDRVIYNTRVLQTGWQTLQALLHEARRFEEVPDLPELPDLTGLNRMNDDDEENVYEQAVLLGTSMTDREHHPLVWTDPDGQGTWVRFQSLHGAVLRETDVQLPGSSRAMKRYFEERCGKLKLGPAVTPPNSFKPLRAWLISGYELPVSDDNRSTYMPT